MDISEFDPVGFGDYNSSFQMTIATTMTLERLQRENLLDYPELAKPAIQKQSYTVPRERAEAYRPVGQVCLHCTPDPEEPANVSSNSGESNIVVQGSPEVEPRVEPCGQSPRGYRRTTHTIHEALLEGSSLFQIRYGDEDFPPATPSDSDDSEDSLEDSPSQWSDNNECSDQKSNADAVCPVPPISGFH